MPSAIPPPASTVWGVVHLANPGDAPRIELLTDAEAAQTALDGCAPESPRRRLARFVEAPAWRPPANPQPPARPREPWEFETVSNPVLVVVECGDSVPARGHLQGRRGGATPAGLAIGLLRGLDAGGGRRMAAPELAGAMTATGDRRYARPAEIP